MKNPVYGTGQHSHEVPAVVGLVVEMRDGGHYGTAIWRRDDKFDRFAFASYDAVSLSFSERCILVRGQKPDELMIIDNGHTQGEPIPHGCDLDSPDGLMLLGIRNDDDLSWLTEGAEVLWDSARDLL